MDRELLEAMDDLRGQIIDLDSHEHMPCQVWTDAFGPVAERIAEAMKTQWTPDARNKNNLNVPGFLGDVAPLDAAEIWSVKGPTSPGVSDMTRRADVLDVAGISHQVIYPTSIGLFGVLIRTGTKFGFELFPDGSGTHSMLMEYATELMDAYNIWALEQQRSCPRLTFVTLLSGESPAAVLENARDLIDAGARVLVVITSELLGGVSPAHEDLGPLWALLSERGVPVAAHVGDQTSFLATDGWGTASFFEGYLKGIEFDLDPWTSSVVHLGAQNFLATMVVGGVFHRHPELRMTISEYGAYWVGPLADLLDMWHLNGGMIKRGQTQTHLPSLPSSYIKSNVRVTPFDFEDVARYIELYGLEDVLCFASDYPHVEGGKNSFENFARNLYPLGPEVMRKFFLTNAQLIVPQSAVAGDATSPAS